MVTRSFPVLLVPLLLLIALQTACSGSKGPESEGAPSQAGTTSSSSGSVTNRLDQVGGVQYKIYFQPEANGSNRKGIILFGSGNDENDPSTGSLDGALENKAANELAKSGYVAAVVAYRDEDPVKSDADWNRNCEMLATDMSNVADAIITSLGGGLNRGKVLTGGVSYASYALLSNVGASNTLADTRGVLATCGATLDTGPKIPIFTLNCAGNPEGDFNGQALIDKISDPKVKADSGFFTDPSCSTHCGGNPDAWTAKLVERVQLWLP